MNWVLLDIIAVVATIVAFGLLIAFSRYSGGSLMRYMVVLISSKTHRRKEKRVLAYQQMPLTAP